ncbi:MAG: hypothetical protein K0M64_10930, partial [Rhizobium sp.]|nr:hypothetical protein [Rhizobium sp.]
MLGRAVRAEFFVAGGARRVGDGLAEGQVGDVVQVGRAFGGQGVGLGEALVQARMPFGTRQGRGGWGRLDTGGRLRGVPGRWNFREE